MLRFFITGVFCWGAQAPPPRGPTRFVLIGVSPEGSLHCASRNGNYLVYEQPVSTSLSKFVVGSEDLFYGEFRGATAVLVWSPIADAGTELAEEVERRLIACTRRLVKKLGAKRVYAMVSPRTSRPDSSELRALSHQVLQLVSAGVPESHILHGASELWALTSNSNVPDQRGAVG